MNRATCMGCDKYDDCQLWLVLPGNYCPIQDGDYLEDT